MEKKEFLGIDVSKQEVDCYLYGLKKHSKFANTKSGFKKMKIWMEKHLGDLQDLLICFEHTGIYAVPLQLFCEKEGIAYAQVSGLEVKRSLGIQRGKNDRVDATRLSEYAYLHRGKLKLTSLETEQLLQLKYLLSFRSRLVRQRAGYRATIKDYQRFLSLKKGDLLIKSQQQMIDVLTKQIKALEKELEGLLKEEEQINKQHQLATSVKGIGTIIAAHMIVNTNCFKDYTKWRKFACYAGSAPFEHSSGSSIHGKTRISHYANKTIKALLTNAAMSAIRHDPEIRRYYQKKIQEGKLKKIVVNNVRNKLISRVFATVNRGTPFIKLAGYAT